jgi:hypothetical protein
VSVNLTDDETVRLIHRERPREDSLEEGECYDHSYGEHVSDQALASTVPWLGDRVQVLDDWRRVNVLSVEADRLLRWLGVPNIRFRLEDG